MLRSAASTLVTLVLLPVSALFLALVEAVCVGVTVVAPPLRLWLLAALVLPTLPPVAWLAVLRVLLSASDWSLVLFGFTVTAPVEDVLAPVWAV